MIEMYRYSEDEELLTQGDLLFNIPVFYMSVDKPYNLPDFSFETLAANQKVEVANENLIVLTQTCDLVDEPERNRKPQEMVVCATIKSIDNYKKNEVLEINTGRKPGYYLLHREEEKLEKSYIIDFHRLHTIPYDYLNAYYMKQEHRIKPTSPYLEKISHHFGNFFSRIGVEFERDKRDLKEEFDNLKEKKA